MSKQTLPAGQDNVIVRDQKVYGFLPKDVIDRLGDTSTQLATEDQTALGAINELKSNLTDLTGFINGSNYITQTADRAVLNYTATQDCWINITVNATGIEIKIDNGTLPVATLSGSASALSSIMLPLKTGQTITSSSAIRIANVFPML